MLKSTGSWYEVLGEDQQRYSCRTRGKLRLEDINETNPVAVGDWVEVEMQDLCITAIHPRTNHILRQSVKKTGQSHVLAANVDQVMLIATVAKPRTSLGFIDRFLVTAEAFRIPQILIFNKSDLLREKDVVYVDELFKVYESIGVTCRKITALNPEQNSILDLLKGKTTLIAGHSGVGKSTLLNQLSGNIRQKIGDISSFSDKGTHTTTFAEMFQLDDATFIIDTPGVKEWGLVDMTQEEISDYFPEMRDRRLSCKFGARCIHLQEPQCAILKALQEGEIALSRYESYFSMVMGEDNRK